MGIGMGRVSSSKLSNCILPSLTAYSDHTSTRHVRRQAEEKGSFGKSTRRRGSTRTPRTQTPLRKENPTLDGFEAALRFDAQNSTQSQSQKSGPTPAQTGAEPTHPATLSLTKEPAQVMLYGYPTDAQWTAINFYETVSGGMICEDYERAAPSSRRRYASGLSAGNGIPRRALTKAELALARTYRGGRHWIKVTFDSREAAERAVAESPHLLQGHWVYATPFQGAAPAIDAAVPAIDEGVGRDMLGAPRPPSRLSASSTMGAAALGGIAGLHRAASKQHATLPRSFITAAGATDSSPSTIADGGADGSAAAPAAGYADSDTSATASSATALDTSTRHPAPFNTANPSSEVLAPKSPTETELRQRHPATFTHFPDVPRTVLKDASEALLPQPGWMERWVAALAGKGWVSGDIIGSAVPRREDGAFDWAESSFYWRFWAWVDECFGTDFCGMREG